MSDSPTLYGNASCPYAQRTRITLLEKGLAFEFVEVDLRNKPDWFLAISPTAKVPLLQHKGNTLFESVVINEYIDEVWPIPALMPADFGLRAQARIWMGQFSAFESSLFCVGIEKELTENTKKLAAELTSIEKHLGCHDGEYFFGKQLSLVDINFYAFFERMAVAEAKTAIRLAHYPRCNAWYAAMQKRDSVKQTLRSPVQHIEGFDSLRKRLNS